MRSIYLLTLIAATSLLTACGNEKTKEKQKKEPAVAVTVSTPDKGSSSGISASGKIEAVNNASLSTRMMGFVDRINVDIGDKVKKGELLVSINNSDLRAKLAQVNAKITEAKAAYNNAEKDYKRFKNLYEENSASRKELDDNTANYEMAKARLEAAKQMKNEVESQFAYVNIRAPFNGVITNKFVEEGDMANPGMPLIAMEAPGNFEVKAMVPETYISSITPGTKVKVHVKSIGKTIPGTVSEVSASAKNTGSQYPVKIALEKTGEEIRSGMYASVEFPVAAEEQNRVVLVPSKAIIHRGGLTGIYTISNENTAMLRWIRLGEDYGDQVEVLSGLSPDEEYIVSANGKLYNGVSVKKQ